MIRLPKIVTVRVAPTQPGGGSLVVRCLGGRAKWTPESRLLSLRIDVIDDEANASWLEFFASNPTDFQLEVCCQSGTSAERVCTSCFSKCRETILELRSATVRPMAPSTTRYILRTIAEQTRCSDPGDSAPVCNREPLVPGH